eukprot:TRINITY_DN3895_c1_g1_i3.p1 TRINITY_DN3895_c1_g1~~TRINITY_DN3895_c1_g1_i3.p1  ORF type:complete len:104 (-),score=7.20 TRINITY_DN3895_c1_g1_i3:450-761(-)
MAATWRRYPQSQQMFNGKKGGWLSPIQSASPQRDATYAKDILRYTGARAIARRNCKGKQKKASYPRFSTSSQKFRSIESRRKLKIVKYTRGLEHSSVSTSNQI